MRNTKDKMIWVAVRVQRGFISDIRAYVNERRARQQESSWRQQANPDYDETAVSNIRLIVQNDRARHIKSNRQSRVSAR
jgi:hypothetical protein